jgi:Tfp pilus assembly protein PilX
MGKNEEGVALISSVLIMMIFMAIGAVFIAVMSTDLKIASNQKRSAQALWIAEAGLQRALRELDQDFESTMNWADGSLGEPQSTAFYSFLSSQSAGGGAYTIELKNIASNTAGTKWWRDRIVVKVTGTIKGAKRVIEANLEVERSGQGVDPGAIFSGSPLNGGGLIVGNVSFRGSIYIKGTATIDALVLSGNAGIFNNYDEDGVLGSHISAYLKARIPEIYDSELGMNSLDARVYIHNGDLNLGGNSYFGKNQASLTDRQPLNGVYVGGTTSGESHVFADVEELNNADIPDIPFPGMLDWFEVNDDSNDITHYQALYPGYTDTELAIKMYEDAAWDLDYYSGASDNLEGIYLDSDILDDSSVALSAGADPPFQPIGVGEYKLVIDKDTRTFSVTQGSHKIEWDKTTRVLNFTGSPLIYVKGHSDLTENALELATGGGSIDANKIQCKGVATIVTDGDINMGKGVAAYDNGTGQHQFPHQSMLTVLTPDKIGFSATNDSDFTGYFYAETQIHFSKQVKIAGALVSNLITYANAPDIYEVPELIYVLPAGVPGGPGSGSGGGSGTGVWTIVFRYIEGEIQPWREVY